MVALFSCGEIVQHPHSITAHHRGDRGRIYGFITPDMMTTEIAGDEPRANQRLFFSVSRYGHPPLIGMKSFSGTRFRNVTIVRGQQIGLAQDMTNQ